MTIIYDKPFLSFQEQIEYLKNEHNLIIDDPNLAIRFLSSISYYDLINGYKECFMVNDKFNGNLSINDLYRFYKFDKNFQSIILKYSIIVENRFKTILAYVISDRYGVDVDDYLDLSNFRTSKKKEKRKEKVISSIKRSTIKNKDVSQPTKYYKKYKNHIPPWILFKNISFNDVIDLYGILKDEDAIMINNLIFENLIDFKDNIDECIAFTKHCLILIRKSRNSIAHNLKFITNSVRNNPIHKKYLYQAFPGTLIRNNDFKQDININTHYDLIVCLALLLHEDFLIADFLSELYSTISLTDEYILNEYFKITGIPTDLLNRFDKEIIKLIEKY